MFGYLLFFLSIFFILKSHDSRKKIRLVIFITVLFSSLRYGIGYDYYGYREDIVNQNDFILSRYEPIPKILMQLAHWFGAPELFFFLSSLFIAFFFLQGIKSSSSNINESVIFYLCFPLLFMDHLGIIRQGMATSVVFYAMTSLKGRYIKQIIFIIIACLCHKSAFVALALLLPLQKINKVTLISLFVFSFIVGDILISRLGGAIEYLPMLLSSKYKEYMEDSDILEGQKIRYVLYIITFLTLTFYNKIVNKNEDNRYYISVLVIGTCVFSMFSDINATIAKRIAMFFYASIIIIIPYLRKVIGVPRYLYYFFCILLMAVSIYIGSRTKSTRAEDLGIYHPQYPYRTIFQK